MGRSNKWNFWRVLLFASVLCLAVIMIHQSQVAAAPLAASQGPKFAGTATSATWPNPSNATGANDNVCATFSGGVTSIDLTNFSFNIPAGSTITGVLVEPKIAYDEIMNTQLLKAGAPVGSVKQVPVSISLPCASTAFSSLGGAGDLWGTTWTPSDINANNFGWRISTGGGSTANLDAVRITVYYQLPTTTTTLTGPSGNFTGAQSFTFTATVKDAAAPAPVRAPAQTGTVTFFDNGVAIPTCTNVPLVGGVATCTVTLGVGTHVISAVYSGDANFAPSTSTTTLTLVIAQAVTISVPVAPVAPKEVLEGDTWLLLGGGIGGLGVWLRWQWGKRRGAK